MFEEIYIELKPENALTVEENCSKIKRNFSSIGAWNEQDYRNMQESIKINYDEGMDWQTELFCP